MKTLSVTKQAKLQYWAGIIKECQNSGQKKRDWLRDHEISRDTYYYWYKEVEKACATSYNKKTPSENTTAFVELPAVAESPKVVAKATACVTMHVGSTTIDIPEHTSAEFLQKLIGALANVK